MSEFCLLLNTNPFSKVQIQNRILLPVSWESGMQPSILCRNRKRKLEKTGLCKNMTYNFFILVEERKPVPKMVCSSTKCSYTFGFLFSCDSLTPYPMFLFRFYPFVFSNMWVAIALIAGKMIMDRS